MSSEVEVPEPPVAERLDPLIYPWPRGERLYRVHHLRFGAMELNPGLGGGRFHPLPKAPR